ncbi:MAG TPA: hypothetical protein VN802_10345 [Stellaceae bacterium]|nr:hypothetical protein [Stellaceae bacterium]
MRSAALIGTAALALAVAALWHRPAQAAISQSCADLRNKIVAMERQVPSGAALSVDLAIRRVYINDCLRHPSDGSTPGSAASDPWLDANGDPAAPPPQGDGVYQTTPEIAGYCQGASDTRLCALMLNLGEGEMLAEGGDPQNPADWEKPARTIDPADELPPLQLSAGGRTYAVDDACLGGLAGILFSSPAGNGLRNRLAANLATPGCAGELGAINAALGAFQDAIEQWREAARRDRTAPSDANGRALQPGFREMCTQAFNNQNKCLMRQSNMSTAGSGSGIGVEGQAGAFGECASLYGSVVAMCKQSGIRFPQTPLRDALRPANPAPSPPGKTASGKSAAPVAPKTDGPAAAGPTPKEALLGQMPASCAPTLQKYLDDVGGSQTAQQRGAEAVDSYQQLAASDECRDAMKRIAAENALDLPERHMSQRTRNSFAAAMAADPARSVPQLAPAQAGNGDGYDPEEVLAFGFALLNLASGAANLANAMHGAALPATNFNSLAAPIIRSPPGQGGPSFRPAPPTSPSTITGTTGQ